MAEIAFYKPFERVHVDKSPHDSFSNLIPDDDEPAGPNKMSLTLARIKIVHYWEDLVSAFKNGNSDEYIAASKVVSSLFYDKTVQFWRYAADLGIPEFVCAAVKNDNDESRTKEIIRLATYLLTDGDSSTFLYFFQNEFFQAIDRFLDGEATNPFLVESIISCFSAVLGDIRNLQISPIPFDISPSRLSSIFSNFFIYGSLYILIGNILFEMSDIPFLGEYVNLAFKKFHPSIDTTRFFDGLCYALSKNGPQKMLPLIMPHLSTISSVIFLKGDNHLLSTIRRNSISACKLLCAIIDEVSDQSIKSLFKETKTQICQNLSFEDLVFISSNSDDIWKLYSMKLLAETLKYNLFNIQILFEADVFLKINFCMENGNYYERIGCLYLIIALVKYSGDDSRLSMFYEPAFLDFLVDFIDLEADEQTKYTLKLILMIITRNKILSFNMCDEMIVDSLVQLKDNNMTPKIKRLAEYILKIVDESNKGFE